MRTNRIPPLLILSLFVTISPSFAEKAEKLPGKIVFRTDRFDGKWTIATLVDGKTQPIVKKDSINPRWSPDGKKVAIVFYDDTFSGFIVVDPKTKAEEPYPSEWRPFMFDWLPGGNLIIFSSNRKFGEKQETGNLFRYDLTTKTTTQLTLFNDGKTISGLAVSPDGRKMLFKRYKFQVPGSHQFYISNTDGSDLEELEKIKPFDPAWSPDGKRIVYTSHSFQGKDMGHRVLSIYDFESGEEKILLEEKRGQIVADQPVFSPNGTQILFSRWSGLYVVNLDGTGLKTVLPPKRLSVDESSSDLEPDWTV